MTSDPHPHDEDPEQNIGEPVDPPWDDEAEILELDEVTERV